MSKRPSIWSRKHKTMSKKRKGTPNGPTVRSGRRDGVRVPRVQWLDFNLMSESDGDEFVTLLEHRNGVTSDRQMRRIDAVLYVVEFDHATGDWACIEWDQRWRTPNTPFYS